MSLTSLGASCPASAGGTLGKVDKKGRLLPALPADTQLVNVLYDDFVREVSAQASNIEGVFNLYNSKGIVPAACCRCKWEVRCIEELYLGGQVWHLARIPVYFACSLFAGVV